MGSGGLYIDEEDVYLQYGVYVVEGGWNDLLSYPPLKEVESNDWQEYDGLEADLSSPVLNTREVTLKFAIREDDKYDDFVGMLSNNALHTFRCEEIGRSFRLRMVSYSSYKAIGGLGLFNVKFADDYPMEGYEYQSPTGGGVEGNEDYMIDEVPTTDYGVRVLMGSLNEVRKGGAVKQGLLRNIKIQSGAIYDSGIVVKYKSKEMKLTCLLRAGSLAEMWRNYYALLHDLIQPEEHLLWVGDLLNEYAFYYKSSQVSEFNNWDGEVWLKFSLSLVFTGEYMRGGEEVVLATEESDPIVAEDGRRAIDMKEEQSL